MSDNEIKKNKGQKDLDINVKDLADGELKITSESKGNGHSQGINLNAKVKTSSKVNRTKTNQKSQDGSQDVEKKSEERKPKETSDEEKRKAEDMFKDQDKESENKMPEKKESPKGKSDLGDAAGKGNPGSGGASGQIDAASSKIPKSGGSGMKLPGGGAGGGASNPLTQGLKKGASNLGNAAKDGAKKAAQAAGKAAKEALKKAAAAIAKAIASNPYALLVIAIVVIILVVGILIYQLFNQDAASKDLEATTERVQAVQDAVNAGTLQGDINQVNKALELNTKYGSYLSFTDKQVDFLYNDAVKRDGVEEGTSKYSLINMYEKKYGTGETNDDGILRVGQSRELYKHILYTEKYNFNKIKWMNYNHNQDGGRELSSDELKKDRSLGIQYPNDSSMSADKFMDLASPYLLSNYIPLSYLVGQVTKSQSKVFNTGLKSPEEQLAELGIVTDTSTYNQSSFAYQILKHAMSDITINQYQLKHYFLNTYYRDYDATNYHNTLSYTETKTVTTTTDSDGNVSTSTSYSYAYNGDLNTIKDGDPVHNNTRWKDGTQEEDVMKETEVSAIPSYENVYHIVYAKCFDTVHNADYTYTKYSEDDASNRKNAQSESIVDEDYNETINKENKIESAPSVNSMNDLRSLGTVGEGTVKSNDMSDPTTQNGVTTQVTTTVTSYPITGRGYVENVGKQYNVERVWDDQVTPGESTSKSLLINELIDFNKNEENDPEKATVDENTLKNHKDYKHYEELVTNKDLNLVDILDSNPLVYSNYIGDGSAESEYIGLGRDHMMVKATYESILNIYLDSIADENSKLNLGYGSSLGYTSADMSSATGNGSYGTAFGLMMQLLHEFEGGGTVYQNAEGVDCYKVLDVVGNMTVGHGIDITVNPQWKAQLEAQMGGASITVGSLVPCEFVDAIEEDFINRKLASIDSTLSSNQIELKEYQKHALLIRMYNTGNIVNFPNAYKSHFNPDVDDRYESTYEQYSSDPGNVSSITSCADLSSALYLNYLNKPVTSNGQTLAGLVTRRREEYYLFSLGYYTHNNLHAFYTKGLSFNGIQAIKGDGSIDVDACFELQAALEDSVFDGKFHTKAPSLSRPWGNAFHPNTVENTDNLGYLSDNYRSFFATSLYYQCPWWSRGRANIYLNSVNPEKFSGQFIRDGLGDGKNLAKGIADAYGVPFYTDLNQLTGNCVISWGAGQKYGHTAYVEAVGNDYYVISHCGSGLAWQGVGIVPKTNFGLGASYGLVGFVKMDDIVAKYGN